MGVDSITVGFLSLFLFLIMVMVGYYYNNPDELKYLTILSKVINKKPRLQFWRAFKFSTLFVVFIFLVYFILVSTDFQLVPDIFDVASTDYKEALSLIVSSLASLSGIVIAILIISFEILKNKLERHAQRYFLGNPILIFLVSLFTCTISIGFISKIAVSSNILESNNKLNIVYYTYFLFMLSLISLIYMPIKILFSFDIYKIVKMEIARVSIDEILRISSIPHFATGIEFDSQKEKSALIILRELSINNLEKDFIITKVISRELAIRFIEILEEASRSNDKSGLNYVIKQYAFHYNINTKIDIFKPFVDTAKSIARGAIKTNNNEILLSLTADYYFLLVSASRIRIDLIIQKDLMISFVEYCMMISGTKNDELFYDCLARLQQVIIECLNSYRLDEKKINELYEDYKAPNGDLEGFKWTLIYEYWIDSFQNILRKCIEENNEYAFNVLPSYILSLIYEINQSKSLGPLQKCFVLERQYKMLCYNCLRGAKIVKFESDFSLGLNSPISHFLKNAIREELPYLKSLIQTAGDYVIDLVLIGAIDQGIIHNLEAIMNCLVEKQNNQVTRQGITYFVKVLEKIKDEMEKSLDFKYEVYNSLRLTIFNLEKRAKNNKPQGYKERLKNIKDTFVETPLPKWIDGHGYVQWEE